MLFTLQAVGCLACLQAPWRLLRSRAAEWPPHRVAGAEHLLVGRGPRVLPYLPSKRIPAPTFLLLQRPSARPSRQASSTTQPRCKRTAATEPSRTRRWGAEAAVTATAHVHCGSRLHSRLPPAVRFGVPHLPATSDQI